MDPISEGPHRQVTQLHRVARKICLEALAEAYERLTPGERVLELEQLFQRRKFLQGFKDSLATGVAETLARHDQRVRAVYLLEPAANPGQAGSETVLHLLVLVERPSAALAALVTALERGFRQCLQELSAATFPEGRHILDVNLITPEAVERGMGFASLLSTRTGPPLKLWERISSSERLK